MTPSTTVEASDDQFTTMKQAIAGHNIGNAMSAGNHFTNQISQFVVLICVTSQRTQLECQSLWKNLIKDREERSMQVHVDDLDLHYQHYNRPKACRLNSK